MNIIELVKKHSDEISEIEYKNHDKKCKPTHLVSEVTLNGKDYICLTLTHEDISYSTVLRDITRDIDGAFENLYNRTM